MPRPASASPVLAVLVLLAACASPGDRSAGDRGEDTPAACMRACNRSYDVCAESGAARAGRGPFSGSASCERDLRQCQAGCRAEP